jgi:predicted RNA-binding protein
VVFYNDELFGVGRSLMTGVEMVEMDRGRAIEVKRTKKL